MPTNYTLMTYIPPAQVAVLKADGLSLFFGKVVQDASGNPTVNVIWSSDSKFLSKNRFEWQENYSIAGAVVNVIGAVATPTTMILPIGLGQSIIIDSAGNLGPASGPVGSGPITLYNTNDKVEFSALLYCTGPRGTTTQAPIYISIPLKAGSKAELTPIETVAIWFAANDAPSTIIPNAFNKAYQVEYLSGTTSHTLSWVQHVSGEWEWEFTN